MKKNRLYLLAVLFLMVFSLAAQTRTGETQFQKLFIGYSTTTSIVFPYAVKSMDKGSAAILIQKAKGVENILLLKAGLKDFPPTNLTVITSDGSLYGFVLKYEEQCPDLSIKADTLTALHHDILFSSENENQKTLQQYASLALVKKKKLIGINKTRFDIELQLTGLFIHQDVMYFRVVLGNTSRIKYDLDQLRFFIHDQKKTKRTASQELEILPLYATSVLETIYDESESTVVFALPKFTIPEKKYLTIQAVEKNGGRQIEINIKNHELLQVEILNLL